MSLQNTVYHIFSNSKQAGGGGGGGGGGGAAVRWGSSQCQCQKLEVELHMVKNDRHLDEEPLSRLSQNVQHIQE